MKIITIKKDTTKDIFENKLEDRLVVLEKNAHLRYVLALKKGNEKTNTMRFELRGEGARLEVTGILLGKGKEKFQFRTEVAHIADNTYGHINMKGTMDDESRTDYFGMIQVAKKNHGADAYLSHHTLLLSKKASARSVPSLEIEANDLKAGHSASVGQVDDEGLFYMKSRGITEQQARKMLTEGFLEEIIQKIENPEIQEKVREELNLAT